LAVVVAQAARLALASSARATLKTLFTEGPQTGTAMGGPPGPAVKRAASARRQYNSSLTVPEARLPSGGSSWGVSVVDPSIASRLQPYLRAGERITWTGRPPAELRLYARDLFLVPFSLLWGGFAIFWEVAAVTHAGPGFFTLWGVPFVVIGMYMIAGRFVVDAWLRSRTVYALTNERALVLRKLRAEKLLTARLDAAVVERRSDGRGVLRFGGPAGGLASMFQTRGMGWDIWHPSLSDRVEFLDIQDVMTPYRLAVGEPRAT